MILIFRSQLNKKIFLIYAVELYGNEFMPEKQCKYWAGPCQVFGRKLRITEKHYFCD